MLRDNLRPAPLEMDDPLLLETPSLYIKLMNDCWDKSPFVRPKFLEAMTRLETLIDGTSSSQSSSSSAATSRYGKVSTDTNELSEVLEKHKGKRSIDLMSQPQKPIANIYQN